MPPETAAVGLGIGMIIFIWACVVGLWIWSLVHCVMNKRLSERTKILGIVLIVLLGLIGSAIYCFLPRRSAQTSRRFRRGTSRIPARGTGRVVSRGTGRVASRGTGRVGVRPLTRMRR